MTLSAMSGAVDPSWTVLEAWASVTPTATTAAHAAPPSGGLGDRIGHGGGGGWRRLVVGEGNQGGRSRG